MIIEGSNPPSTKVYPQTLYWVDAHIMTITQVELVRNSGWHSMIHVTADGKSVRDERLFHTPEEAINFACKKLGERQAELAGQTENFNEAVRLLLTAQGDA